MLSLSLTLLPTRSIAGPTSRSLLHVLHQGMDGRCQPFLAALSLVLPCLSHAILERWGGTCECLQKVMMLKSGPPSREFLPGCAVGQVLEAVPLVPMANGTWSPLPGAIPGEGIHGLKIPGGVAEGSIL